MNVWIMNLKDNRTEKPEGLQSKFQFCFDHNLVGIGWVGYDEKPGDADPNYTAAKNLISQFQAGDLVWTRDPDGVYYLCLITSPVQMVDDEEYSKNDIGLFCRCTFHRIGDKKALPATVDPAELISRRAITSMPDKLADATRKFAEEKTIL